MEVSYERFVHLVDIPSYYFQAKHVCYYETFFPIRFFIIIFSRFQGMLKWQQIFVLFMNVMSFDACIMYCMVHLHLTFN